MDLMQHYQDSFLCESGRLYAKFLYSLIVLSRRVMET